LGSLDSSWAWAAKGRVFASSNRIDAAEAALERTIEPPRSAAIARSLSDLELYDSFPSSKRLKNDCHALIRPCIGRFSTLMRLFLPFGQSYPASTWSRFKL